MATTEDDDDYQNGKVYGIICNITNEKYIGSTILTLDERLIGHKTEYNRWLQDNNYTYLSSFQILERGDYKIILLESCPCNNSEELRMREREWFDKVPNVNIRRPFRSKEEEKEYCKEYVKEWKKQHQEQIREQNKEYYEQNKERLKEQQKVYREQHKEQLRERYNKPFICECGSNYTYANKSQHLKTQKHQNYLNTKEATEI